MNAPSSKRHRLPATFRSLSTLRVLNVLAVATALAGATGMAFGHIDGSRDQMVMLATALSTFLLGVPWAIVMRGRQTVGTTGVRTGWFTSIPLAALNAATACAILAAIESSGEIVKAFIMGGTVGALVWLPALLVVLALFGLPIAHAQSLAEKGLAGEERGERAVGLISTVVALAAFALLPERRAVLSELGERMPEPMSAGRPLVLGFLAVAVVCGVTAALLATYRDRVRRAFVRKVEAGGVRGFRVDPTPAGQVLVRFTAHGAGYRAATFDEEVYDLDQEGDATRARTADP